MAWLDNQAGDVIVYHPIDDEVARIIVPGVEVNEPPGERLHRYIQARAVLMVLPVPSGRAFTSTDDVTACRDTPFQNIFIGLDDRIRRRDTRRKPRRTRHRLPVLLEVGNVQKLERVGTEEISDVGHPGRNAAILEIAGFELYRLAPVHRVNDIDELPIHLAPSNLLFPQ